MNGKKDFCIYITEEKYRDYIKDHLALDQIRDLLTVNDLSPTDFKNEVETILNMFKEL